MSPRGKELWQNRHRDSRERPALNQPMQTNDDV